MKDKRKNTQPGPGKKPGDVVRPVSRRRKVVRRVSLWGISGFVILLIVALITAVLVVGQQMHAPDWLRERVASRIERGLGGLDIEFGDVNLVIREGWRPRIRLQDVTLSAPDGQVIAQVADAQASLAMRPLLRGQVQPKRISLSGAFVRLRRQADGTMSLSFDDGTAPVGEAANLAQLVETADAVFMRPQFASLVAVDLDALTLTFEDLQKDRIWTLDGGFARSRIEDETLRMSTGFSLLGGRDYASAIEANYSSRIGRPEASFGISISDLAAEDIAAQTPALGWLEVLKAPISGAVRGSIGENGAPGLVSATLQIGEGVLQPNPNTRPIPFASARTYFTYDPSLQELQFDEVSVDTAWGSASSEGRAYLEGVESGVLQSLEGQFGFSDISLNPDQVFFDPLNLNRADLVFRLNLNPFHLQLGELVVAHEDRTLRMSGGLIAEETGWNLSVDGLMDQITPEQVLGYWPEQIATKPREWVRKNLTEARISDLDFALRTRPGTEPEIFADFEFEDATIRYARTLPPMTRAGGQASLLGRRFSVVAQRGRVVTDTGDVLDAAGSSFIIPDIGIRKAAPGIARIQARGALRGFLSMLERPPLRVMSKANLPVELGAGTVEAAGTLSLPLKQRVTPEDLQYHFTGVINNVESDRLVPGHRVSSPGLLATGNQIGVTLTGPAFLGEVPASVNWHQPIGPGARSRSQLTGQIELSRRLLDELNVGLPSGMVAGEGVAEILFEIGGGEPAQLTASSDLIGTTLAIPQLGWRKAPSTSGVLSLTTDPTAGGSVDDLLVQAAGLNARGSVTVDEQGNFRRARFNDFRLRNWISGPVELTASGRAAPNIRISGGVIDMRNATFGSGSGAGTSTPGSGPKLSIALDRLQITETLALSPFRGDFSTGGGPSGNFEGRLNGATPLNGQVLRRGGRSGFFVQSEDAGGVFRSSKLLTRARGGTFQMSLEPVGPSGHYDGRLKVRNTRVTDAPAMAALLNAISVVGLLDEMSGAGIQFTEIDGRFRLSPTAVTITQGSAIGPSIGLSADGTVDTERSVLNLRGVISPVYLLNAIGSVLTRKGEGVIGFTYSLTGPLASPVVRVNPLSGLAPGFLREIFRGAPPPVAPVPGETPPPEPERPNVIDQRQGEDR